MTLLLLGPPSSDVRLTVDFCAQPPSVKPGAVSSRTATTTGGKEPRTSQRAVEPHPQSRQGTPNASVYEPLSSARRGPSAPKPGGSAKFQNGAKYQLASKTGIYNLTCTAMQEFPNECLAVPNIRVLTLQCGLRRVPPEISAISSSLQKLILSSNRLGSMPSDLSTCSALQQMDLSNNMLETLLPDCFGAMVNLKEVMLSHNRLQSLPASIGAAKNLKILDVSSNRLCALPASIGDLANLEDLDCSSNRLSSLPSSMGGMKRLKRVNASQNQVAAGSIPGALLRDTPIDTLRVEGNPIPGLEGEDGYNEYAKRVKTQKVQNVQQGVGTGDLSRLSL